MSFTISRRLTRQIKLKLIESNEDALLQIVLQPQESITTQTSTVAISSHWKNYLPYMNIQESSKRIHVNSQGVANLTKLNMLNTIRFGLGAVKCIIHYFRYCKDVEIFLQILKISLKTRRMINFDMTKHGILFSILKKEGYLQNTHGRVTIIGDGFGFAGCLIKAISQKKQIHFHNLSRNTKLDILFTTLFLESNSLKDMTYSNAEFTSQLPLSELFINVASFGEMNLEQISSYLQTIRNQSGTLISLNRESKTLPDNKIIKIEEYGWLNSDEIVLDEEAEFYRFDPSTGRRFEGSFRLMIVKLNKI